MPEKNKIAVFGAQIPSVITYNCWAYQKEIAIRIMVIVVVTLGIKLAWSAGRGGGWWSREGTRMLPSTKIGIILVRGTGHEGGQFYSTPYEKQFSSCIFEILNNHLPTKNFLRINLSSLIKKKSLFETPMHLHSTNRMVPCAGPTPPFLFGPAPAHTYVAERPRPSDVDCRHASQTSWRGVWGMGDYALYSTFNSCIRPHPLHLPWRLSPTRKCTHPRKLRKHEIHFSRGGG